MSSTARFDNARRKATALGPDGDAGLLGRGRRRPIRCSCAIICDVVEVVPISREWAEALTEGNSVFEERFGLRAEDDWAVADTLPYLLKYPASGQPGKWGPHLFFVEGVLVGNGGWKGSPVDGVAEIGYAVAPSRRGQGIATAAVRHFTARARSEGLKMVLAYTVPSESASTTVLGRCGFEMVGLVNNRDGAVLWRWELAIPGPGSSSRAGPEKLGQQRFSGPSV